MADYCARELDDVVHRLLPPEIFADIGIVEGRPSAARRSHAVVEELAARLVGILGLAGMRKEHASPPARATPYNHSQGCGGMDGVGSRAHVANGGNGGMARRAPGFGKNGTVFDSGAVRRLPRFAPIAPCAGANPPSASTGTGVFLPRAELYEPRVFKSHSNGAKPPRLPRMDAANAMMKKQQQLHAMAAAMEQKEQFATAFGAYHPELLALPQEWMY